MIKEDEILRALEFYGVIDEDYKNRCLDVVRKINKDRVLCERIEKLLLTLYDRKNTSIIKLWKIKDVTELFGKCDPFITSIMILMGYKVHIRNMNKYKLDENQIIIHKRRVKETLLNDILIRGYKSVRISQMLWASYFINLRIIEVGALQYEVVNNNPLTNKDEICIKMHIPRKTALDIDKVNDSINKSRKELYKYFGIENVNYYMESWMLSLDVLKLLNNNSNILVFSKLFDIKEGKDCKNDILNFVFEDCYCTNYENLSEKTYLQRKLKKMLINNIDIRIGIGKLINTLF